LEKSIYKDSKTAYMVIKPGTDTSNSLSMNMMKNNKIQCLLDMECRYVDNNIALYYKIQGLQCLKEYFSEYKPDYNMVRQLYLDIAQAVVNGGEFFLDENSYVLDLEYIYWDKKNKKAKLCCVPGWQGDFQGDIKKLAEDVIMYAGCNDKAAESFLYGIYGIITDDGFIVPDIQSYIKKFKPHKTGSAVPGKPNETNCIVPGKLYKTDNDGSVAVDNSTDINVIKEDGREYAQEREYIQERESTRNTNCIQIQSMAENSTIPVIKKITVGNVQNGYTEADGAIHVCRADTKKYSLIIEKASMPQNTSKRGRVTVFMEDIYGKPGEKYFDIKVGRCKECGLVLPFNIISRYHAVIHIQDGQFYIEDTASANGTFLNGQRIPANVKTLCNVNDVVSFAGIKCHIICQ